MTRKKALTVVGVLVLLAAAGAWWWRAPEVEVVRVVRRTVQAVIDEEGKTRLSTTYTVDMPITGTLQRPDVEIGDTVKPGQVVARVDPFEINQEIRRLQAEITQQRAQIEGVDTTKPKPQRIAAGRAQARQAAAAASAARDRLSIARVNLDQARTEFERQRKLLDEGAVSRSRFEQAERAFHALEGEVEEAESGVRAAEAAHKAAELDAENLTASVGDNEYLRQVHGSAIDALEAQVAVLQDRLTKTELQSPVTGVVLEKAVESKRVLQAGAPVVVVGRPEDIEVESDILSEEVERVRLEDPVEISGEALLGQTVLGRVARIYPAGFKKISALGIEQQRVKVIVAFDNSKVALRPGVRVDVRIVTASHENVPAVPDRVVFREGGRWQAFAVKDDHLVLTPVDLGLRNDQWAEIRKGLSENDLVAAEPGSGLKDGMRVRPLASPE